MTANQRSFSRILAPGSLMPSRSAATEPEHDRWAVARLARFSQLPWLVRALSASSRSGRAAWTVMPAAISSGTASLRRTRASTAPTAVACWTGPIRSTIATAFLGSLASLPSMSVPASAVSRLVPSAVQPGHEVGAAGGGDAR